MVSGLSYEELINHVAQSFGIEPEYHDIWGKLHVVTLDVKKALLEAMGISTVSRETLESALLAKQESPWLRTVPPAFVVTPSRLLSEGIPFQLPSRRASARGMPKDTVVQSVTIEEEHGAEREIPATEGTVVWEAEREIDGIWYIRCRLKWKEVLECGYYRVRITTEGFQGHSSAEVLLVLCPERAYLPVEFSQGRRYAGLQVPLFSVHSRQSWGVGDLRDLGNLALWAADSLGVDFIGFNPLHAIFNRSPFHISPYNPSSRIFRNLIYLAPEEIPEFKESYEAQELLTNLKGRGTWKEMVSALRVDYEKTSSIKKQVLEKVFQTFLELHWRKRGEGDLRAEGLQSYIEKKGEPLKRWATFSSLEEFFNGRVSEIGTWRQWPRAYQDPASEEVEAFQRQHEDRVLFHAFLQWQLDEQMKRALQVTRGAGLSMGFYLDMALGVDPWGADRWAFQDVFAGGVRVGAPPDDFSPNGQDWGIPPVIPDRLEGSGYRFFVETIRENCAHAGMLRIDHVMGIFRVFWIPEGARPVEGAYVKMPANDLLGILTLESHRNRVVIIGEDLGTVPTYIRGHLKDINVLSSRLFYFERDPCGGWRKPSEYPGQALVAITTHDLPTLEGYWEGRDISIRQRLGLFPDPEKSRLAREERDRDKEAIVTALDAQGLLPEGTVTPPARLTEELQCAVIGYLARTPCWLLLLNHEDVFRDEDQLNLPGTLNEYPNWTARMRHTLEKLREDPDVERVVRKIRLVLDDLHKPL